MSPPAGDQLHKIVRHASNSGFLIFNPTMSPTSNQNKNSHASLIMEYYTTMQYQENVRTINAHKLNAVQARKETIHRVYEYTQKIA